MRITNAQEVAPSLVQATSSPGKLQPGFIAALDAAQQKLAQSPASSITTHSTTSRSQPAPPAAKTAADELAEYLRKSPAEHLRDKILKEMGLTEEALDAMPPEQRAAIEDTIAKKIKEFLLGHESQTQQTGDSTAAMLVRLA